MSRPPLTDVRTARGISIDRDPDSGDIVIWLHGADLAPIAGVCLPLNHAVTVNERLTAACRRSAVEASAGPAASEGIH